MIGRCVLITPLFEQLCRLVGTLSTTEPWCADLCLHMTDITRDFSFRQLLVAPMVEYLPPYLPLYLAHHVSSLSHSSIEPTPTFEGPCFTI